MDWNVALVTVATDRPENDWVTYTVETIDRVDGDQVGALVATVGTMVGVLVVSDTAGFTRMTGYPSVARADCTVDVDVVSWDAIALGLALLTVNV